MMQDFVPRQAKVTVITVVLNAVETIEETILSIIGQTHRNIEFIVQDGGSTDGTLDVIGKYRDHIDRVVCEPDSGIYDAMNKAACYATGDYINFMNAGDQFLDERSLEDFLGYANPDAVVLYSGWVVRYADGRLRNWDPRPIKTAWKGMFVQHQSVLARTKYVKAHPFDGTKGNGADFEFLAQMVVKGMPMQQVPGRLSLVSADGVSDRGRIRTLQSHWEIARTLFPSLSTDIYHLGNLGNHFARLKTKKILSKFGHGHGPQRTR